MGRQRKSSEVFSPEKTRARKAPMGLVIARMIPKKSKIWKTPMAVIVRTSPATKARRADNRTAKRTKR
jgi:hypothetical protein